MLDILSIEKQQEYNTYGDAGIGKIEYRREEYESFATPHRNPVGPCRYYQGEIEHIYHFTLKHRSITLAEVNELRYREWCRHSEYLTIEEAVEDVASSTCTNERQAEDISETMLSLYHLIYIIADGRDGCQTKQCQQRFIDKRHAVSHAVVFYKGDIKPVCYVDAFAQMHARLDPDLYDLVNDEQQYDKG